MRSALRSALRSARRLVVRARATVWCAVLVGLICFTLGGSPAAALQPAQGSERGAELFAQHCAGCHINGGNIIRRAKTLKLAALQRQGIDSEQAIAAIAANGVGQMSGYRQVLGDDGVEVVASWVWLQAQNAWIQG